MSDVQVFRIVRPLYTCMVQLRAAVFYTLLQLLLEWFAEFSDQQRSMMLSRLLVCMF